MAFDTYAKGGLPPETYQKKFSDKDLTKEFDYDELWKELFHSEESPLPQVLTKAHRIVVVDADAIVYRISAACEKRSVVATVRGKEVTFKTKTKLKEYCQKIGEEFEGLEFENVVKVEPVENAFETLRKTVAKIYRELNATHVIFFLGGSYNFRTDLKLPTKYKSNRKTTRRPDHLQACREFLNEHYDTFLVSGIEADDCVQGVTEYIINRKQAYACAYQLDKDFHTSMTKNRYWHIDKKQIIELDGGIGSLQRASSGVRGDGLHWVLFQLMQGDSSDGYSPKTLYRDGYKGRYGEVSYFNDFVGFDDGVELLINWVNKWEEVLPENIEFEDFNGEVQKHNWLSLAEIYFQCLYMRMSPVDDMTFEKLLQNYGLFVDKETGYLEQHDLPEVEEDLIEVVDEVFEDDLEVVTNSDIGEDGWGW